MPITGVNALSNAGVSKSLNTSNNKNSSKNTSFSSSNLVTSKNNKLPYLSGGVILLAIAAFALHRKFPAVKKSMKNLADKFTSQTEKNIMMKIKQVKSDEFSELNRIIKENTSNDILRLDGMDAAALMRAKDKTRPNHLHEAANMLEESYKIAYEKSKPEAGRNMFDKILFRIEKENDAIVQVYSQMPAQESAVRLKNFSTELEQINSVTKASGMKKQTFFEKVSNLVNSKRGGH